jgi:hypothetical protein
MKQIIWLCFLSLGLFAFSCEKEYCECDDPWPVCYTTNPIEELPWLKQVVTELEDSGELAVYFYVVEATYQGQTVFIVENCCPQCGTTIPLYNCQGEIICNNLPDCPEFGDKLSNRKVIYKHPEAPCQLQ